MSKAIMAEYKRAGVTPPKGKGQHTLVFHKCAVRYMKKGMEKSEAYKRCMGGLGRDASVKKAHRDPAYVGGERSR